MSGLEGKRVLVTRPRAQARTLLEALERRGAQPLFFPTLEVRPVADPSALDRAIGGLEDFAWIVFTSANAVRFFWERLEALRPGSLPPSLRVAAVGPATAFALADRGAPVHASPDEYRGARIAEAMGDLHGLRVLVPRADIGRESTVEALRARGASVEAVVVYHTVPAAPDPESLRELERGVDVATFASPSAVRNFVALLGEDARRYLHSCVVACIGPVTEETARELGFPVHVRASESTAEGLVAALAAYSEKRSER